MRRILSLIGLGFFAYGIYTICGKLELSPLIYLLTITGFISYINFNDKND